MTQPKISVLGTGSWGSALALTMAQQGRPVTLWGHDPHHVEEIKSSHLNPTYVPGMIFPNNILLTHHLLDCCAAELMFVVVPSPFLRAVATKLAEVAPHFNNTIVSCTKGIEHQSGKLMSEVLAEILPRASIAVLSGPNLAGDIARGLPAAGVLGCEEPQLMASLLSIFQETSYRAYGSSDLRGIQLGGALKNIFAIAAAISDGLGMGENAKAGIVTRSLAEMTRLGTAMGGERQTFSGLSGVGDLMVTCFSPHSRNYQAGLQLCHGKSATEIQHSMVMVAEGLRTALSAQACAQQLNIDVPIIDAVVALLHQKKTPQELVRGMLERALKTED